MIACWLAGNRTDLAIDRERLLVSEQSNVKIINHWNDVTLPLRNSDTGANGLANGEQHKGPFRKSMAICSGHCSQFGTAASCRDDFVFYHSLRVLDVTRLRFVHSVLDQKQLLRFIPFEQNNGSRVFPVDSYSA